MVPSVRRHAASLVACLLVSSCAAVGESGPEATPRPSESASKAIPEPAYSAWRLGSRVLPLRSDGYGQVRSTPPSLRVRRYPTVDLLAPPTDGLFHATVSRIGPDVRRRMGRTWEPGCPVPIADLRYVTVSFRGFDPKPHTGELVLHEDVARGAVSVFRTLFLARFPIEEMRLPTTADLDAPPTGDGNNTVGMVCRASRSSSEWSAHALGLAVDINPFMNPYTRGDLVLPELASSYTNRRRVRPGMILPDGVVVRAFRRIGWTWGGTFRSVRDPMHFSANGR